MEESKPAVSIIIPVYNAELWLEGCLDSVTGQDLQNIEIICVNDGSTDKSAEIMEQFAARDPRVRILTHEANRGIVAARKTGVMTADGEYIMFVDADDTIDAGLCSCVYDLIRERGTDILEFTVHRINTETKTEMVWKPIEPLPDGENVLVWLFCRKNIRWNFLHTNN